MWVAATVVAIFLGSLIEPALNPVSSSVRSRIVAGYDWLPGLPNVATPAQRRLSCHNSAYAAWGPPRVFYTWKSPASVVTIDSIADNPAVGFEGRFLTVKYPQVKGETCRGIQGQLGDEVEFQVYVENSAASNLGRNAEGLRLHVDKGAFEDSTVIRALISATNSREKAVWSDAVIDGVSPGEVMPVPGSARIYSNYTGGHFHGARKPSNWIYNRVSLPGDIWTRRGALIGASLASLGTLTGSAGDSFYITFDAWIEPAFGQTTR